MALKWQDYIEERKDVMLGKPVFKGTRLTVEHVLRELGSGMSPDELFDSYPNLWLFRTSMPPSGDGSPVRLAGAGRRAHPRRRERPPADRRVAPRSGA